MLGFPSPLGFGYFAAVKFAGYYGYSALLHRGKAIAKNGCRIPPVWKAGLVRTGIGIAVGTIVWIVGILGAARSKFQDANGGALFLLALVPVSVLEWLFFLWLLYQQCQFTRKAKTSAVAGGVLTSFLLDILGLFAAFTIPGGAIWIC